MMAEFPTSCILKLPLLAVYLLLMSITCAVCLLNNSPKLTITPVNPEVLAGSDLNITCITQTSYNASDVVWKINGVGVEKSDQISRTEAVLTLRNLTIDVEGRAESITCNLATIKVETKLLVGTVPPSPTLQCRSTNITDYWCEWSTGFTGVRVNYNFQFQKKDDESWTNCTTMTKENLSCSVSKKDGNPRERHQVRVTAQNTFGASTTALSFDPKEEAIPLPPIISSVSVNQSNMTVFWELQENCYYCLSLKYELRYRNSRSNTNWTNLTVTRIRYLTVAEVQTGAEYELEVRSRFLWKNNKYSEWSPKSLVSVPPSLIMTATATPSDTFSLRWKAPPHGSVEYYRITGNYTDQSFNRTMTKEVTVNYTDINVPCNISNRIIHYNLELNYAVKVQEVMILGPPSSIVYEFKCLKEVLVNTTAAYVSDPESLIPFLLVGLVVLFGILLLGGFNFYFRHKHIFIQWPEPKFFNLEINSIPIEPRFVEKEIFDELKPKRSDCLTSYHSSTSSDQGFHELSPHSPVDEERSSYVTTPFLGLNKTEYQVSPVKKGGTDYLQLQQPHVRTPFLGSNPTEYHVPPVIEEGTEYLQLQQTGNADVLQLSPLLADNSKVENNSNPYTAMTLMMSQSDKPQNEYHPPEVNYVTDPYCKLDEILRAKPGDNHSASTEYIPVFTSETTDYSGGEDGFIGEDAIQNLLNGTPQQISTMNYLCTQDDCVVPCPK